MVPLLEKYKAGEIDEVLMVHTVYVNTLKQEVHVDRLLPIDPDEHDHERPDDHRPLHTDRTHEQRGHERARDRGAGRHTRLYLRRSNRL